jgi:uncharacterized RDD family membrane protein YckC
MSNVPPPPPPGGGFPPPDGGGGFQPPAPPGGAFPPPTPPGGGFAPPAGQPGGFAGYSPTPGSSQLAGFWVRFGAYFIDSLIVGAFTIPARIAFAVGPKEEVSCSGITDSQFAICEGPTGSTLAIGWSLMILAWVAGIIYFAVLEGRGQTVGCRALSLRIIDANNGGPIGTGRGVGRYFARFLSAIPCFLGFFWMLWDDKNQTWQDKLVSSLVIRER